MSEVGLVHDYLLVMRGAERTFVAMSECWPGAPLYTLLYDEREMRQALGDRVVRASYLQKLPVRQSGFRRLMPLYPRAIERLEMGEHRLIVSSSSAFAHGVRIGEEAQHVCYCHTPFRYAWHERERGLREFPAVLRPLAGRTLERIRRWDLRAAARVTHFIANAEVTRRRIQENYGRDATVVHPPVQVERFRMGTPEDFFLVVTELVPHKRVDVALEACRLSRHPIKVVGTGPDLERLRGRYGESAEFLGRIGDEELDDLYGRAKALIVPNVEEFGIAAVEAQASGRPVVAAAAGGALETVVDGTTGILVEPGNIGAFAEAIGQTDFDRFNRHAISIHAQQFSASRFRGKLKTEVERLVAGHPEPTH